MADRISIDNFDGKKQHVDSEIQESQFMDSARTVIYGATTKAGTDEPGPFRMIGLVQSFGWSERKQLSQLFELGSDIPYMIPGRTTGNISLQRVLLSGKDLLNALYHGDTQPDPDDWLKSLSDTSAPLFLMFVATGNKDQISSSSPVYSRVFANCHIVSRQESIGAGQRVIMEGVSIAYSHMLDAKIIVR